MTVISNEANRGFSHAVNQAAAAAQGKTLVAVNQDLHLQPGALKAVHEFLALRDVVVGGALSYQDGAEQPSCGPFPTLAGTLWRLLLPRRMRKYELMRARCQETRTAAWVTGAFMGFRRTLFDRIGGFDEGYFMYYEDVDFCMRARHAGVRSDLHRPRWERAVIRALNRAYFLARGWTWR